MSTPAIVASREFWLPVWGAIREDVRRRIALETARAGKSRAEEVELWLKPAELLEVLEGPVEMFTRVPRMFLRWAGKTVLTYPDFRLLQSYAEAGVKPGLVLQAVQAMFIKYTAPGQSKQINSIAYCNPAVLEQAQLWRESMEGSRDTPEDREFHERMQDERRKLLTEREYPAYVKFAESEGLEPGSLESFLQSNGLSPKKPTRSDLLAGQDARNQTLLIALPRKGRAIYKAVARRQMLEDLAAKKYGLGLALTVQPDEYELARVGATC